jgi:hypothetical protein
MARAWIVWELMIEGVGIDSTDIIGMGTGGMGWMWTAFLNRHGFALRSRHTYLASTTLLYFKDNLSLAINQFEEKPHFPLLYSPITRWHRFKNDPAGTFKKKDLWIYTTFDPYHRETVPLKNFMDPHKKTGCKFTRILTSNYKKQQTTVFYYLSVVFRIVRAGIFPRSSLVGAGQLGFWKFGEGGTVG